MTDMETDPENLTLRVLRQIRDEIVTTRTELAQRIDHVSERVDHVSTRIDHLDTTMNELAQQQAFVVRHLRGVADRDRRIEAEVDDLRGRVGATRRRDSIGALAGGDEPATGDVLGGRDHLLDAIAR